MLQMQYDLQTANSSVEDFKSTIKLLTAKNAVPAVIVSESTTEVMKLKEGIWNLQADNVTNHSEHVKTIER